MANKSREWEAALLDRIADGQQRQDEAATQRAIGELYMYAQPVMLLAARRVLRSVEEAEDVVQRAFLGVLRHLATFDRQVSIRAYCSKAANNGALNVVRDQKRRGTILEQAAATGDTLIATYAHPEDAVEARQVRTALLRIRSRLTDEHAEILRLRYDEDLSYGEIEARLGVQPGTVMSRLSRATAAMRAEVMHAQEKRRGVKKSVVTTAPPHTPSRKGGDSEETIDTIVRLAFAPLVNDIARLRTSIVELERHSRLRR